MELSLTRAQAIVSKHAQSPLTVSEITLLDNIRYTSTSQPVYQTYRFSCYTASENGDGDTVSNGSPSVSSHHIYLILISHRDTTESSAIDSSELSPIDIHAIAHTLSHIASRYAGSDAHIAFPHYVIDDSKTVLSSTDVLYIEVPLHPSPYREVISLANAVNAHKVGEQKLAAIELKLGRWMKDAIHGIEGEEFGVPRAPLAQAASAPAGASIPGLSSIFAALPPDPIPPNSYSWQETFMQLVENVLHELQGLTQHTSNSSAQSTLESPIPFADIQTLLSRTIAFFLFDDVEVPQLSTSSLSAHDVLLSVPTPSNPQPSESLPTEVTTADPEILYILPTFAPSMTYADPLLEGVFAESHRFALNANNSGGKAYVLNPSPAFMAGYGASPVVFKRQRTKRLWYDLYEVLIRLRTALVSRNHLEQLASATASGGERPATGREELMKEIKRMVDGLRDAPCY